VAAADVSADFSMNRPLKAAVALVKGPGRSGSSSFDRRNRPREMNIFVEPAWPDPGRAGSVMRQIHPFRVEAVDTRFLDRGCVFQNGLQIDRLSSHRWTKTEKDKIYSVPQKQFDCSDIFLRY